MAKDNGSRCVAGPSTSWLKAKVRHDGRSAICGIVDNEAVSWSVMQGRLRAPMFRRITTFATATRTRKRESDVISRPVTYKQGHEVRAQVQRPDKTENAC